VFATGDHSPQADAGWIGEAGPGPSYLDAGSGGPENDFTNRNTTFMTWNLLHAARMLKDAGGIPDHGNQPRSGRRLRFGFENPRIPPDRPQLHAEPHQLKICIHPPRAAIRGSCYLR
jgi:hypothetical protein